MYIIIASFVFRI